MPSHADVPAETDILCEHCGYGLNGLPTAGRCPECGQPIADSTKSDGRVLPPWEQLCGTTIGRLLRTTMQIVIGPAHFFRRLRTRTPSDASGSFANWQHTITAILLGITAAIHADVTDLLPDYRNISKFSRPFLPLAFALIVRLILGTITKIASALTQWEGTYWGYRLPSAVVRRAMNFHSAQLLPVSLVALITVAAYWFLLFTQVFDALTGVTYLMVLSIEVLLAAGYLFRTYWIAMKNIMYANR